MARLLLPWGRRGQASAGGRGKLSADEFGEKQKRGFSVEKEKQCGFTHGKSNVVLDKVAGKGAGRLGRLRGNVRFLARGGDSGGAGRRGMW